MKDLVVNQSKLLMTIDISFNNHLGQNANTTFQCFS
jgi:hypothetical protein